VGGTPINATRIQYSSIYRCNYLTVYYAQRNETLDRSAFPTRLMSRLHALVLNSAHYSESAFSQYCSVVFEMSRSEKGQDQQPMTTAKQSQRSSSALVGETHNAGKPQNAKLKI
jgi:hypothetical protein